MGDPLSVAASIVAVVTAGVAIAKGLYRIVDDMGSAGQEVRIYASDIQVMTSVLQGIGEQLDKKPRQSWSKAESVIEDILALCNNIINPIHKIQDALVILLNRYKDSSKKLRQVRARVWWFFKHKDKMLWYRQSLQNLNITLNTHLAAMKLNAADNVTINISVQQSTLQLCMAEAERLLHDRNRPQLMSNVSFQGRLITNGSTSVRRSSSAATGVTQTRAQSTIGPDISERKDEAEPGQQESSKPSVDEISQALILYPAGEDGFEDEADGLGEDEISEVESTILGTLETTPDSSVQEIWEDMGSVLRKVVRYAEEVRQASTEPPPQAVPRSSATEGHTLSVPNEDATVVSREPSLARSTEDTSRDLAPSQANDQVLKLKNIDGRTYMFPYESVQKWPDAEEAFLSLGFPPLYEKYINRDGKEASRFIDAKDIFRGRGFYLAGPEGTFILPQFWSQTVQPGWTVELQFVDVIEWPGKPKDSANRVEKALRGQSRSRLSRLFKR